MVTVCYFEATPGKLIVEFGSSGKYAQKSVTKCSRYGQAVQTEAFEGDYSVSGLLGFDTVLFSAWIS
jgi:hypothetical protein